MNATFETVMRLSEEVEQAESDEKYKRKADEKWAAIGAVLEQGAEDDKFRSPGLARDGASRCSGSGGVIARSRRCGVTCKRAPSITASPRRLVVWPPVATSPASRRRELLSIAMPRRAVPIVTPKGDCPWGRPVFLP